MKNLLTVVGCLVLASATWVACTVKSADSGGGAGQSQADCPAGDQKTCACSGGGEGVQVCRDDGSGYDACTGCPSGTGGAGGGGPTCTIGFQNKACGSCAQAKCMTECVACQNSTNCPSYMTCCVDCMAPSVSDVPGCFGGCYQKYPDGNIGSGDLNGCLETNCAQECDFCPIHVTSTTCDSCLQSSCTKQCFDCRFNMECYALTQCLGNCATSDTQCSTTCTQQYPNGVASLLGLVGPSGCAGTTCKTECQ